MRWPIPLQGRGLTHRTSVLHDMLVAPRPAVLEARFRELGEKDNDTGRLVDRQVLVNLTIKNRRLSRMSAATRRTPGGLCRAPAAVTKLHLSNLLRCGRIAWDVGQIGSALAHVKARRFLGLCPKGQVNRWAGACHACRGIAGPPRRISRASGSLCHQHTTSRSRSRHRVFTSGRADVVRSAPRWYGRNARRPRAPTPDLSRTTPHQTRGHPWTDS